MWFIVALFGYALSSVVLVLDKLILTKSLDKPVVYTFYSTIFLLALVLGLPFVDILVGMDWIWALVSGLGFGFGLWAMFSAVKKEEASHMNPFIGGMTSVATFLLAATVLRERLSFAQSAGMSLLIIATIALALSGERKARGVSARGWWLGVLAGMLFAVSHTSAKYIYDIYPFATGFVWTRAATGLVGIFCLVFPSVRETFRRKESKAVRQCRNCGFARKHAAMLIIIDKIIGVAAVVFIQYAIALGSVTLVNAMVGLQYALMLMMIYFLTEYRPKFFKEHFARGEMRAEVAAIFLVIVGAGLLAF